MLREEVEESKPAEELPVVATIESEAEEAVEDITQQAQETEEVLTTEQVESELVEEEQLELKPEENLKEQIASHEDDDIAEGVESKQEDDSGQEEVRDVDDVAKLEIDDADQKFEEPIVNIDDQAEIDTAKNTQVETETPDVTAEPVPEVVLESLEEEAPRQELERLSDDEDVEYSEEPEDIEEEKTGIPALGKEAPVIISSPEFEEPVQLDSVKSPKSFTTEEDIISDVEDKITPIGSTPNTNNAPPLSQVLTSSSSFAAVSLPPSSSENEYENIKAVADEGEAPESTIPTSNTFTDKNNDEFTLSSNTPATTQTRPISSNQEPKKPVLLSKGSEATLQTSNIDGSALKIPGGYPTTPEAGSVTSSNPPSPAKDRAVGTKRTTLLSRFKSLFK